ncbi:MAG: hypothetical protein D6814_09890 [Calditrichaeota bacterium]|nr:MAG: hypothetical protein D6814_09890 [Calditrichota bacterium]
MALNFIPAHPAIFIFDLRFSNLIGRFLSTRLLNKSVFSLKLLKKEQIDTIFSCSKKQPWSS